MIEKYSTGQAVQGPPWALRDEGLKFGLKPEFDSGPKIWAEAQVRLKFGLMPGFYQNELIKKIRTENAFGCGPKPDPSLVKCSPIIQERWDCGA